MSTATSITQKPGETTTLKVIQPDGKQKEIALTLLSKKKDLSQGNSETCFDEGGITLRLNNIQFVEDNDGTELSFEEFLKKKDCEFTLSNLGNNISQLTLPKGTYGFLGGHKILYNGVGKDAPQIIDLSVYKIIRIESGSGKIRQNWDYDREEKETHR